MACLDTSALIDCLGRGGSRRRARVRGLLASLLGAGEQLATTRVCASELWVGVERSTVPRDEERRVESLLAEFVLLELDERATRWFGKNQARLLAAGTPVGDFDVLIASIAMANDETLITRDAAGFSRIAGLRVQSY